MRSFLHGNGCVYWGWARSGLRSGGKSGSILGHSIGGNDEETICGFGGGGDGVVFDGGTGVGAKRTTESGGEGKLRDGGWEVD